MARWTAYVHVVPLTAKVAGAVLLFVNVPVKPIVTALAGAIVELYDSAAAVTCSPDCVPVAFHIVEIC